MLMAVQYFCSLPAYMVPFYKLENRVFSGHMQKREEIMGTARRGHIGFDPLICPLVESFCAVYKL